jgi:hypothetical protein
MTASAWDGAFAASGCAVPGEVSVIEEAVPTDLRRLDHVGVIPRHDESAWVDVHR